MTRLRVVIENALWDLPAGGLGQYLGSVAFMIGVTSMGFLVSALSGYIAFAIADRPGIAPGFVAGAVAVLMNAGFIGGIVGGLLAGFVAWWLGRLPAPRWLRGLMPVVIIPLHRIDRRLGSADPVPRPTDRDAHGVAEHLADRPRGHLGNRHRRRHPRPHDVLRPRRPGQQGGVRLRRRRPRRRLRRRTRRRTSSCPPSWRPAWCRRSRWRSLRRCSRATCSPRSNGRTA